MKRFISIILSLIIMLSLFSAFADEEFYDCFGGFTGIFEVLSQTDVTDFNSLVTTDEANRIIKKLFGNSPFKSDNITNADLVEYLSTKVSTNVISDMKGFKDAGLIERNLRKPYAILNSEKKLYDENGYLKSSSKLNYKYLIGSLYKFENEILKNLSVSLEYGKVISVSLEDGITNIRYSFSGSTMDKKIKSLSDKKIAKNSVISLYNRNILRDDTIYFYSDKDGKVLFINIPGQYSETYEKVKDTYDLYKGEIYYADTNIAIVKNTSVFNGKSFESTNNDVYTEFLFNNSAYFEHNFMPTTTEEINTNHLDKTVYIICDKNKNAKYFNISE